MGRISEIADFIDIIKIQTVFLSIKPKNIFQFSLPQIAILPRSGENPENAHCIMG